MICIFFFFNCYFRINAHRFGMILRWMLNVAGENAYDHLPGWRSNRALLRANQTFSRAAIKKKKKRFLLQDSHQEGLQSSLS